MLVPFRGLSSHSPPSVSLSALLPAPSSPEMGGPHIPACVPRCLPYLQIPVVVDGRAFSLGAVDASGQAALSVGPSVHRVGCWTAFQGPPTGGQQRPPLSLTTNTKIPQTLPNARSG